MRLFKDYSGKALIMVVPLLILFVLAVQFTIVSAVNNTNNTSMPNLTLPDNTSIIDPIGENEIKIDLEYNPGTQWDPEDDGIEESLTGIVDLNVLDTEFGWEVDESKLCTEWEVDSKQDNVRICHGTDKCCGFIDLDSEDDSWDELFFVNYGRYSAGYDNDVYARVIYVDYNLSPDDPFADIYYSEKVSLPVKFTEPLSTDVLTRIVDMVVSQIKVIAGSIVKTSATLEMLNDSPLKGEQISLYINDTLLDIQETDEFGSVEFDWNTSPYIPDNYLIHLIYPGQRTLSDDEIVNYVASDNSVEVSIVPAANITFDPVVKDANGNELDIDIEVKDKLDEVKGKINKSKKNKNKKEGKGILTEDSEIILPQGEYKVNLTVNNHTVKSIEFNDLYLSENVTDFIGIDDIPENDSEFVEVYAIDPTKANFTEATVTVIATGTELYKCKDWDFDEQSCYGEWVLFKTDLVPGEEYTFTLTPDDPGFGEILITKAMHLDENKTLINDIYNEVKELDGNWSKTINSGEFVRVSFELNLTSINDITVYPRTVSGNPRIEIYEKDSSEVIAEFVSLTDNGYNKVYLDGLIESQDIFDLKVIGGEVEFDHIIDPTVIIRPTAFTDSGLGTVNPTFAYDSDHATAATFSLNSNGQMIEYYTFTNTGTDVVNSLNVTFDMSVAGTSNDQWSLEYSDDGGVTVYVLRASASGDLARTNLSYVVTEQSAGTDGTWTFAEIQNNLRMNLHSDKQSGPDGATLSIFEVWATAEFVDAPPSVTLNAPSNGRNTTNTTITFSCNATDDLALKNITLYHNITGTWAANGTNNTNGTSNSTTFTNSNIPDGRYIWNCLSYDSSAQFDWGDENFSLTVDATPPNVTQLRPLSTSTYNITDTVLIAANVTDLLIGVDTVRANLTYPNGSAHILTLTLAGGSQYNTNLVIPDAKGTYNITILANDSLNNVNDTEKTSFRVINSYPNVTALNYPGDNAQINKTFFDFNFTVVEDNYTNVASCSLYSNLTGSWALQKTIINVANDTETNISLNVPDGNHLWNVLCTDGASLSGWYVQNYTVIVRTQTKGLVAYS